MRRADSTRVLVLADTHLVADVATHLPRRVLEAVGEADVVLHAGDVIGARALDELDSMCCLHAVLGNNDTELAGRLEPELTVELGGVEVQMVHDSGPSKGRAARLRRRYPTAGVVVFGHSHRPLNELAPSGQRLFNPGSPTQRRAEPFASIGWLELGAGRVERAGIELLSRRGSPAPS